MPDLIATHRMTKQQAHDFMANLDFKKLKESSLWARYIFVRDDTTLGTLKTLVDFLYRNGYQLAAATFENLSRVRGPVVESVPVALWTPQVEDVFEDDTVEYNIRYPVVELSDPYPLVQQGFMIREAFKKGVKARTEEVRAGYAAVLGITKTQLMASVLGEQED